MRCDALGAATGGQVATGRRIRGRRGRREGGGRIGPGRGTGPAAAAVGAGKGARDDCVCDYALLWRRRRVGGSDQMSLRLVGLVRESGEKVLRREHGYVRRWRWRRWRVIVALDHRRRYGRWRPVVQHGWQRHGSAGHRHALWWLLVEHTAICNISGKLKRTSFHKRFSPLSRALFTPAAAAADAKRFFY